jgi:hypothetical protein
VTVPSTRRRLGYDGAATLPEFAVSERNALVAAVLDDPARLVLADCLRESDDRDDRAFGRFLWAGVVASRFDDTADGGLHLAAKAELNAITSAGLPARWLYNLGFGANPLATGNWTWDTSLDRVVVRSRDAAATFARGMLAELAVTLDEWYDIGLHGVLARWPVEVVLALDVPGLAFWVEPPGDGGPSWRLEARLAVMPLRPPGRRRGLLRRLGAAVFGTPESEVRPLEALSWSACEDFPNRAALVASVEPASGVLVEELRGAAGAHWPDPSRGRR